MSTRAITRKVGCSEKTVRLARQWRHTGIPKKPESAESKRVRKLIAERKLNDREIAEAVGVSVASVFKRRQALGVPRLNVELTPLTTMLRSGNIPIGRISFEVESIKPRDREDFRTWCRANIGRHDNLSQWAFALLWERFVQDMQKKKED